MVRLVSIGLFSMYGAVPDLISIDLADALLFAAFAVTWTGARVFGSPSARHSAGSAVANARHRSSIRSLSMVRPIYE
jgi:hypothetical protein